MLPIGWPIIESAVQREELTMSVSDRSQVRRRIGRKNTEARRENGTPPVLVTGTGPATGARRAMSTGAALFIIAVGAIMLFALTAAASPSWINLHTVGIILILTGVLGLLLPRVKRFPGGEFRRWVVPMTPQQDQPSGGGKTDLVRRPGVDGDYPTLADDLLREEHDPPIAEL
jgi:hypothetical protein